MCWAQTQKLWESLQHLKTFSEVDRVMNSMFEVSISSFKCLQEVKVEEQVELHTSSMLLKLEVKPGAWMCWQAILVTQPGLVTLTLKTACPFSLE